MATVTKGCGLSPPPAEVLTPATSLNSQASGLGTLQPLCPLLALPRRSAGTADGLQWLSGADSGMEEADGHGLGG